MLNGKYVSAFEIIRRVYRDSATKADLPYQDAVEWATDCMDLINVPAQNIPFKQIVTIEGYKGRLPCNYLQMTQAQGATLSGRIFPMTESLDTFHPNNDAIDTFLQKNPMNQVIIDLSTPIAYDAAGNPVFNFIGSNNSNPALTSTISQIDTDTLFSLPTANTTGISHKMNVPASYKLVDNYIQTSYETGYALLSYQARPFDCEGFPMIPDNISYKFAIQWYIQEHLDYIAWRSTEITDKVYSDSVQKSDWYIGKAQNSGQMPGVDKMEGMRKTFTKLMLPADFHKRAFRR